VQALLGLTRNPGFAARAGQLGGYDVRAVGEVAFGG
jgi:hypothetical protein